MAQTPSTESLYTVVKNTSGGSRFFGFLGNGGIRLANNEQVSVRGNLVATLGASRRKRNFTTLETALENGDLQIVSTPAPVLYDAVAAQAFQLALQDGCLGVVDPTWDAAGVSDFSAPDCP